MTRRFAFLLPVMATGLMAMAAQAEDIPENQAPGEPLSRGPVHEAYAQPWEKNPMATEPVQMKPPATVPEQPPGM